MIELDTRRGYERLMHNDVCLMADTPELRAEMLAYSRRIDAGHVLVCGLGLGLLARELERRRTVRSIVVIEREEAIINLVRERLRRSYLICADIYAYLASVPAWEWDVAFFDHYGHLDPEVWSVFANKIEAIVRDRFGPRRLVFWGDLEAERLQLGR